VKDSVSGRAPELATIPAAIFAALMLLPSGVWAQQRQTVTITTPASNTKYTQQHAIDVGDVPGHQVRVYEIHRTYGVDGPLIQGVRLRESWTRGISDYTELSGPGYVYSVFVMENGDKFYTKANLISQSMPNLDGPVTSRSIATAQITGGTGKFKTIRGTLHSDTSGNIKTGFNQTKAELEYWTEE